MDRKNNMLRQFEGNIEAKINQRRRQVLIHSFLYYRLNESIISDTKFDQFSRELVDLQNSYPDIASKCIYHEDFIDFDGTTGYDLRPLYGDSWVEQKARKHLEYHKRQGEV